jgi:hypothetical protein
MPTDRLFVPLAAFCWEQFGLGKTVEVRCRRGQWLPKHVRVGRRVELRRGYSGPSKWGTIIKVAEATSVHDLMCKMPWRKMMPYAHNSAEAEQWTSNEFNLLSPKYPYPLLAFEMTLD